MCVDLKKIYTSVSVDEADVELQGFSDKWDDKYPVISQSWKRHWPNIITLFDYPDYIRKVIYTTSAIESLNSQIRKAIKNRRIFPTDNSGMEVLYLAIEAASKKWTIPIRNWKKALNRFAIEFENRMPNL